MFLIAGLGNPGSEYASTRHNIGFLAIDALAPRAVFTSKFHSEVTSLTIDGEKCLLVKPQTYMNNSGRAIQAAAAFYKIEPSNILILHDELDLPLGKIRIKQGGGANGHNGIKDIDQCIGPDYWRVRLGIGHPGDKDRVHDHVLSKFSAEETKDVERVLKIFAENFPLFWQVSPEKLASMVGAALNPPPAKPQATPAGNQ